MKKNLAVAGLVLFWVVLIWAVTMVRLSAHAADYESQMDATKAFSEQREKYVAKGAVDQRNWDLAYNHHQAARDRNEGVRNNNRILHRQYSDRAEEVYFKKWDVKAPLRHLFEMVDDRSRVAYLNDTTHAPDVWWDDFKHGKSHIIEPAGKTDWPGGSRPKQAQTGETTAGQMTMTPGTFSGNGRLSMQTSIAPTAIENAGDAPAMMIIRNTGNPNGTGGGTLRLNSTPKSIDTGGDGIYHETSESGY